MIYCVFIFNLFKIVSIFLSDLFFDKSSSRKPERSKPSWRDQEDDEDEKYGEDEDADDKFDYDGFDEDEDF